MTTSTVPSTEPSELTSTRKLVVQAMFESAAYRPPIDYNERRSGRWLTSPRKQAANRVFAILTATGVDLVTGHMDGHARAYWPAKLRVALAEYAGTIGEPVPACCQVADK